MAVKWIILSGICFSLLTVSTATTQETPRGQNCAVCNKSTETEMHVEQFKGRWVAVCLGKCSEHWTANPNLYFLKLQSRGVLFDENSVPDQKASNGWLYLGMYVLIGLIFGAMCAYVAVTNGHLVLPWFFFGLFFNVIGLAAVFIKGQGDLSNYPAGVPAGFAKVPLTYTPVVCQTCRGKNHPSASVCSQCGAERKPSIKTETSKLL